MEQPIKTALLAYGMSGKVFHAPFLVSHEGFELVAIVERSKNDVPRDYPNVAQLRDMEDVFADASIELVVINTPNFTHFELAKRALLTGKHVLIEKPVCVSKAQGEELFALAEEKNLKVLPYQNRRFDSDFASVKKVLERGVLGDLVEVQIRFDRYRNEISHKTFKEEDIAGAGIFYDLGAHVVDQAISLFGKPDDFSKTYSTNRKESLVDDFAQVLLIYNHGPKVVVTANMLVVDAPPAYAFFGTSGSFYKDRTDVQEEQLLSGDKPKVAGYGIERPGSEGKLSYFNEAGDKLTTEVESSTGNYMELFDAVYSSIREGKPYFVSKEEALTLLSILEKN